MSVRHLRAAAWALYIVLIATSLQAYPFGPPPSMTGAFGVADRPAEGLCTTCHASFAPNDPSGRLRLLDLPPAYVPGQTYTFRLRLEHPWSVPPISPRWGFQIQAVRQATGDSAGAWFVTAPDSYQVLPNTAQLPIFASRRYLEHTALGIHEGQPGPAVEWAVHWQAPPADSGLVYFFAAANSANGDSRPFEDYIFTAVDSLRAAPPVNVEDSRRANGSAPELGAPYPNPATSSVAFSFTLPEAEPIEFMVFDMTGRVIRDLGPIELSSGPGLVRWDGRGADGSLAPSGIYLLRLRAPARGVVHTRRFTFLGGGSTARE